MTKCENGCYYKDLKHLSITEIRTKEMIEKEEVTKITYHNAWECEKCGLIHAEKCLENSKTVQELINA